MSDLELFHYTAAIANNGLNNINGDVFFSLLKELRLPVIRDGALLRKLLKKLKDIASITSD